MRKSEQRLWHVVIELIAQHMNACANPKPRSQTRKAVVLRIAGKNASRVLALRREQEQMLGSQWGRSTIGLVALSLLAMLQLPSHAGCG